MPNISQPNKLKTIEAVARLLDSQFKIGGFRFGLDPILNLIPVAGGGSTALVSILLVYTMGKHGASNKLIAKMLLNVGIDFVLGAIPFLGWIFDFYFKANNKNVKLLKEHYEEGKHTGGAKGILLTVLIAFVAIIALMVWLAWIFTSFLIDVFS